METSVFNVVLKGTRPLLMHRIPTDLGNNNNGRKNTYDQFEEAEAALYRDKNGTIIMPMLNILAALKKSGTDYKVPGKGKKTYKNYIYSGVRINQLNIPLAIPDGSDPDKSWEIDTMPVVVGKARIMRSRPRFDEWLLEFKVEILDPIITGEALKQIFESAGKYIGLCDFRPLYGLFEIEKFSEER